MQGRTETNRQYEKRIKETLKNQPKILKDYINSISSMTSSSRIVYLRYIINFLQFLADTKGVNAKEYNDFANVKKIDIDNYMEYIRFNQKTMEEYSISIRNAKLSAVKNFFEFLADNDIITQNPCNKVKKVQGNVEHEVVYLTPLEIDNIKADILCSSRGLHYNDPWVKRDYAMFLLFCTTGMRKGAVREINIQDLDLAKKEVKVLEKRNQTKIVYLGDQTCEAIQDWVEARKTILKGEKCDALFISNQRKRMSTTCIDNMIKKHTESTGKHISPHKLRSTCAMNLYEATGDIYLVAQQLGHKNIQNTQIYAKATKERMRETAELMDKIYE